MFNTCSSYCLRFLAEGEEELFPWSIPWAVSNCRAWSPADFALWQIRSSRSSISSRRQHTAWAILISRCCNQTVIQHMQYCQTCQL